MERLTTNPVRGGMGTMAKLLAVSPHPIFGYQKARPVSGTEAAVLLGDEFWERQWKRSVRVAGRFVDPQLKFREIGNFIKDPVKGLKQAMEKTWDVLGEVLADTWNLISQGVADLIRKAVMPFIRAGMKNAGIDKKMQDSFASYSKSKNLTDVGNAVEADLKKNTVKTPIIIAVSMPAIAAAMAATSALPVGAAAMPVLVPALLSELYDMMVEIGVKKRIEGERNVIDAVSDDEVASHIPVAGAVQPIDKFLDRYGILDAKLRLAVKSDYVTLVSIYQEFGGYWDTVDDWVEMGGEAVALGMYLLKERYPTTTNDFQKEIAAMAYNVIYGSDDFVKRYRPGSEQFMWHGYDRRSPPSNAQIANARVNFFSLLIVDFCAFVKNSQKPSALYSNCGLAVATSWEMFSPRYLQLSSTVGIAPYIAVSAARVVTIMAVKGDGILRGYTPSPVKVVAKATIPFVPPAPGQGSILPVVVAAAAAFFLLKG